MKNIVLIGMTGSRKSSVGKQLAERIGCEFVDSDHYLELVFERKYHQQKSFTEIYQQYGVEEYGSLENESLRDLQNRSSIVIATGGGTPLSEENRKILKELGVVVLLTAETEELVKRIIARGYGKLPTLPNIQEIIDERWSSRKEIYEECADFTFDSCGRSISATIDEILSSVEITKCTI